MFGWWKIVKEIELGWKWEQKMNKAKDEHFFFLFSPFELPFPSNFPLDRTSGINYSVSSSAIFFFLFFFSLNLNFSSSASFRIELLSTNNFFPNFGELQFVLRECISRVAGFVIFGGTRHWQRPLLVAMWLFQLRARLKHSRWPGNSFLLIWTFISFTSLNKRESLKYYALFISSILHIFFLPQVCKFSCAALMVYL